MKTFIILLLTIPLTSLAVEQKSNLIGKTLSEIQEKAKVFESVGDYQIADIFINSSEKHLLVYSKSNQKILDAVAVQSHVSSSFYGSLNCGFQKNNPIIGLGYFEDDGKMQKHAAFVFNAEKKQFEKLDLTKLNCKLDCTHSDNQYLAYCAWQMPCEKQDPSMLSPKCVQEKCPTVKTVNQDLTIVGLISDGIIIGSAGISKKSKELIQIENKVFTAFQEIYDNEAKQKRKISYTISFDGIETERCHYSFNIEGFKDSTGLKTVTDSSSQDFNGSVHKPSTAEIKVFGLTHKLCKKESCGEPENWNENTLFAVSDLNQNGKKEYWYKFADGYRYWYQAKEHDAKKKTWHKFYEF